MTFKLEDSPMVKADPSLALPWPPISQQDRELARRQRVASFCLNPCYQQMAKEHPRGEMEYWSKFSVGGIAVLPSRSTPFSPEELMQMSYMEIVQKAQELDRKTIDNPAT